MSRHRNVRSMNYTDEYDGYDDVYGHSVEDDYCISPSDAAFIYDRDGSKGQQKISAFFKSDDDIAEEDETDIDKASGLDDVDKARLNSCIDKIKSVIGETKISEQELISLILKYNFEVEKVIDIILSSSRLMHTENKPIVVKEKDVNNGLTHSLQQIDKDNLPNMSFSSLSNLVSNQSKNIQRKIEVPKLFTDNSFSQTNSSKDFFNGATNNINSKINAMVKPSIKPLHMSKVKFDVPKLFDDESSSLKIAAKPFENPFKNLSNISVSSSHTSLSSLVSSHLGNSENNEIPKLFNDVSPIFLQNMQCRNLLRHVEPLTENMSKCNITSDSNSKKNNNDWHIDLSNALRESSDIPLDIVSKTHIENKIRFTDIIGSLSLKSEEHNGLCKMDISDIILLNNNLENNVSRFGKVICKIFRCRAPNLINFERNPRTLFNFNTPSPDDFILSRLNKT